MEKFELEPVLDVISLAVETGIQAVGCMNAGDRDAVAAHANQIKEVAYVLKDHFAQHEAQLFERSNCRTICENLISAVETLLERLARAEHSEAEMSLKFEVVTLLRDLKEDLYFYHAVIPDKVKFHEYYEREFAENTRNIYVEDHNYKFDISIVVVAFNKLDYTKLCVENIFKHTDFKKFNCEFITINNGSSDGTKEYFDSLPHHKKINFKTNAMSSLNICIQNVAEGRILALIPNDVIVTKNWLPNLMKCMESDSRIAIVVPVTNHMSNLQTIPVSYKSVDEMLKFAKNHNVSNPDKWEERARLLPTLWMLRMDVMNEVGFGDRYFYYGEFGDDDISLRYRRRGYKQMFCKDTFVHHYGSLTSGDAQRKNNSLGVSRQLFFEKYGVDAWDHDFCYDLNTITALKIDNKESVNILGVDSGYGNTPLFIKNVLREQGNYNAVVYNFTCDNRFVDDLRPIVSDHFAYDEDLYAIEKAFAGVEFDYIYIAPKIERYDNFLRLARILCNRLKAGGRLAFKIANPYYILNVISMCKHELSFDNGPIRWYDAEKTLRSLAPYVKSIEITGESGALDEQVRTYATTMCQIHGQPDVEKYISTLSRICDIVVIRN